MYSSHNVMRTKVIIMGALNNKYNAPNKHLDNKY